VSIVEKLAKFCIQFSFTDITLWTEEEQSFSTMRNLYKTYHKFFIVDGQSEDIEKFKKVWQIF